MTAIAPQLTDAEMLTKLASLDVQRLTALQVHARGVRLRPPEAIPDAAGGALKDTRRHSMRLSGQDMQGLRFARAGHQPRDQEGGT